MIYLNKIKIFCLGKDEFKKICIKTLFVSVRCSAIVGLLIQMLIIIELIIHYKNLYLLLYINLFKSALAFTVKGK